VIVANPALVIVATHVILQPAPSQFLENEQWKSFVRQSLYGKNASFNITESVSADMLDKEIHARFDRHKESRIVDKGKRSHWSLSFAQNNFSRLTAIAVMFGHVNPLKVMHKNSPLLSTKLDSFVPIKGSKLGDLEGSYLYFDTSLGRVIRSGKVVGQSRSISIRNSEHAEGSKLRNLASRQSLFYLSYRDGKCNQSGLASSTRGIFEDLECCVGLGFSRDDEAAVAALCSNDPIHGIFYWSADTLEHINKVKFPNCSSLAEKQLHMIGYLTELYYDLMIPECDNVSQSPGFETCLGIFGGTGSV